MQRLAIPLLFLALPAAAQDVTLTLYTSQPNEDAQQTVDAFMAANPDVAVEFVRDGTTQIMARLLTEIAAGQAQPDVLLIADDVTMESLEAEGHLLAYSEADVSAYPAGTHDDEGHYFATKLITTGLIRNAGAPMELTSWADLMSEEVAGQVVMPSPLTSGAGLIFDYATLRGVDGLGQAYFEGLAEGGALASGGNGGMFQSVAGGEKMYGIVVDFLPIREAAAGSPVEFVFPEEGVSAVTEPVAIMAGTDAPEAATALRRLPAERRGAAARRLAGLSARASGRDAAAGLSGPVRDHRTGLRRGRGDGDAGGAQGRVRRHVRAVIAGS